MDDFFKKNESNNFLKNNLSVELQKGEDYFSTNILEKLNSKIFQLKNLTGTVVGNTYMSLENRMSGKNYHSVFQIQNLHFELPPISFKKCELNHQHFLLI